MCRMRCGWGSTGMRWMPKWGRERTRGERGVLMKQKLKFIEQDMSSDVYSVSGRVKTNIPLGVWDRKSVV